MKRELPADAANHAATPTHSGTERALVPQPLPHEPHRLGPRHEETIASWVRDAGILLIGAVLGIVGFIAWVVWDLNNTGWGMPGQ